MEWFGQPWPDEVHRATVCEHDELRTEVPVGQACGMCAEPIQPDDRGVWLPHVHLHGASDVRPIHLTCLLHDVFPDVDIPIEHTE